MQFANGGRDEADTSIDLGGGSLIALIPILLFAVVSPAFAQKSPKPRSPADSKDGGVASTEEPDFTRFRVVTDEGILVVFDSAEEWDGRSEPASQLAYWHDFATEQLFFFDQLLFTEADVLQSIATMQRDLGIDTAPILGEKPEFVPLPDIVSLGLWRPAVEFDVLAVMGGGVAGEGGNGEVSGVILPCAPGSCPEPLAASGPLPAPVRDTPRSELFAMALSGSVCDCWGGGGPPPPSSCTCCVGAASDSTSNGDGAVATNCCVNGVCNDGNPCTVNDLCGNPNVSECGPAMCCGTPKCPDDHNACTHDSYSNGHCIYAYLCDDNNACTADTCDPAVGCSHTTINCIDDDICTTDGCDSASGCVHGAQCPNPDRSQCCGFDEDEFACCTPAQVCCRYHWAGEGHPDNGCCPAGTTCCDTHCCQPDYVCCGGTACCLADHCCANGVCCTDICNECVNYGFLWGGTIAVDPAVACVGDLIRFSADGVVDSGGTERVECGSVSIQVPPTYSWIITKPDGSTIQGIGPAAIVADLPGIYWCGFSVRAIRHCPPSPLPLGPIQALAIRAEMDPITSGISPVPTNPAIVAPMTPLLLSDFTLWWYANTFGLTKLEPPDVDLTALPITWRFNVTSGFLTGLAQVVVASDKRSARLEIPFPSWGNLGDGVMEFRVDGNPCASATTLIKNVQPDLEPGEFRFQLKAHLCTDGQGTSTARTPAEVRAMMADVTKVLSQCGIIVTLSEVVTTTVDPEYMRLDTTTTAMSYLFGFGIDDPVIDVYFIQAIDYDANQECGQTTGITSSPGSKILWLGGVAIGDNVCDGTTDIQAAVRTVAHELVHYLLNHNDADADADHVENEPKNLMSRGQSTTKRDLTTSQCLEMRANRGGN